MTRCRAIRALCYVHGSDTLFCGCYMKKKKHSEMLALYGIKWVKNAQFAVFYYQNMSFQQIAAYIRHDCHFDSPYRILCFLILMSMAKVNHKSTENFFFVVRSYSSLKIKCGWSLLFLPWTTVTFWTFFSIHPLFGLLLALVCHIHSLRMCVCFPSIFYNDKCDKLELINSHKKQQQILARI